MQPRLMALEEGKDLATTVRTYQPRALPLRVLQFFLVFLVLGLGVSVCSMYMIRYFKVPNAAPVAQPNFVPSFFVKLDGIQSWIRPPSNLLHIMNDTELLWRASFVPQIKIYPYDRVPKIAFMFLTKGPLPMAPLWERFFKGHDGFYSIYVHAMPSCDANYPPSSVFYRRQIPSQVTEWGRMTMCDAERRLLANALLDISNEWFILLSEACIPLHNFSTVYSYLSRSKHSFVGSFDEPGPYGRGRYNEKMAPLVNLTNWRKGPQWFEVNRELAVKIIADVTYYPKFKDFCRPACYVDEHYFQTMLSIETPHLIANRSLTYVDWSRGGAHPATFGKVDIKKEFFKKIFNGKICLYNNQPSSLCYLFARKFAPSALEPLLELSSEVLGF
ncbi:glycosyltransferase BC10 [Quercus suber]|uniref:glycosyltransferase BC10 n=1 Tax=Quercus suber TaxID=58331 RepID=UPI0032DF7685